jgi:hypothetical protein
MARILAEKSESSFSPSHSFRRCKTFWRGSGLRTRKEQGELLRRYKSGDPSVRAEIERIEIERVIKEEERPEGRTDSNNRVLDEE